VALRDFELYSGRVVGFLGPVLAVGGCAVGREGDVMTEVKRHRRVCADCGARSGFAYRCAACAAVANAALRARWAARSPEKAKVENAERAKKKKAERALWSPEQVEIDKVRAFACKSARSDAKVESDRLRSLLLAKVRRDARAPDRVERDKVRIAALVVAREASWTPEQVKAEKTKRVVRQRARAARLKAAGLCVNCCALAWAGMRRCKLCLEKNRRYAASGKGTR